MRNIKLITEYDGTDFFGWQRQPNARTVQETLELAISDLTGEVCSIIGSSRTDTGVHAFAHASNFHTNSTIPAEKFAFALNTRLPQDVSVKASLEVDEGFHARFDTRGKQYRYLIYNSSHASAINRNRAFFVFKPLDIVKMKEAAEFFVGEHDFKAFMAVGGSSKTTVRTMFSSNILLKDEMIAFEIVGNGFLYNMVRIMAGTLVEVGMGKLEPDIIYEMLKGKDRRKGGRTAPPQGLYLMEVLY
jgi:tRNA pseudouridine38-40 synthase